MSRSLGSAEEMRRGGACIKWPNGRSGNETTDRQTEGRLWWVDKVDREERERGEGWQRREARHGKVGRADRKEGRRAKEASKARARVWLSVRLWRSVCLERGVKSGVNRCAAQNSP